MATWHNSARLQDFKRHPQSEVVWTPSSLWFIKFLIFPSVCGDRAVDF